MQMPTMTYEDYLEWRGMPMEQYKLEKGERYFIEKVPSTTGNPTIVYEGDFLNIQGDELIKFKNMVYVVNPYNIMEAALNVIPIYSDKYKIYIYKSPRSVISKTKLDKNSHTKSYKVKKTNSYPNNAIGGKQKKRKSKTRRHKK